MRVIICRCAFFLIVFFFVPALRAGLHYSAEEIAPLPSQWKGFLIDQRLLRTVAFPPAPKAPPHPFRVRYEKALADLESQAKKRELTADESADLGALHVRLGKPDRAVAVLRAAQRQNPRHYRIVSNLATAWQLTSELAQAEEYLREAILLAPGNLQRAEEYQLKLVRHRRANPKAEGLDPLLPIRFVNDKDEYEPGKLARAEVKKLPAHAVADLQMLALWLPADGKLLWLLGELAAVHGDLQTAAAIFEGCVSEFALAARELRQHRALTRDALERQAKAGPPTKSDHEGHAGLLKTRATRPLVDRQALVGLPPVKPEGLNALPWNVVTLTNVDRQYKPTFPHYLRELDGKQVTLTGYIQPLGMDPDLNAFLLIEYPVGCWFCETPDLTAIVLVELPPGKAHRFTRDAIHVTGKLQLNSKDPEDFLYKIVPATVQNAD